MVDVAEPTDEELRAWWIEKGSPPVTYDAKVDQMSEIVAWLQATTVAQWAEGQRAPYDLYDLDGVLVEAVAADMTPIIAAGDKIPTDLGARILAAACPSKPEPVPLTAENEYPQAVTGTINPDTFVGIHIDDKGDAHMYSPGPEPLLLTWASQ